jgi:hypothetical protein
MFEITDPDDSALTRSHHIRTVDLHVSYYEGKIRCIRDTVLSRDRDTHRIRLY